MTTPASRVKGSLILICIDLRCISRGISPPGKKAWELIAGCGWQGRGIGGALVSERHANFVVNTGTATAADIEALIETIKCDVARQTGVKLETEVKIVGVPAAARPVSEEP